MYLWNEAGSYGAEEICYGCVRRPCYQDFEGASGDYGVQVSDDLASESQHGRGPYLAARADQQDWQAVADHSNGAVEGDIHWGPFVCPERSEIGRAGSCGDLGS